MTFYDSPPVRLSALWDNYHQCEDGGLTIPLCNIPDTTGSSFALEPL